MFFTIAVNELGDCFVTGIVWIVISTNNEIPFIEGVIELCYRVVYSGRSSDCVSIRENIAITKHGDTFDTGSV